MPDSSVGYKFIKVENYFNNYQNWDKLNRIISYEFDQSKETLSLKILKSDGSNCLVLIQLVNKNIFRVRFNPRKTSINDFTPQNTRSIVMDTLGELKTTLRAQKPDWRVELSEPSDGSPRVELITIDETDTAPFMKLEIAYNPFKITAWKFIAGQAFPVWTTADPCIYYTPNGNDDCCIIQAVSKPTTAIYVGFGEQGGKSLSKNTEQLVYFNFDNMRYRQVYGGDPFEDREPLYHSDPFFMEFNGIPDKNSVYGLFIDNPSQLCIDIGVLNSNNYMFGTRFGDLDYYVFIGETCGEVLDSYTSIVGKSRLKPRYGLGYHQGCYGYEDRGALEWIVNKYREYRIPLDGLHIDVDIQKNYRTFTIDESKFLNPKEMFAQLRAKGVKCSTNITPIISNREESYTTYKEGKDKGYFISDKRFDPGNLEGRNYQDYEGGNEQFFNFTDPDNNFNQGQPFVGEVFYGGDRGTTGHYADLARKEVRMWWGTQYQFLFDMGLEMVWQDMTTPAIRDSRGDMKGFPFRLMVTDDFLSDLPPQQNLALKVWSLYSYNLHKATYHGLNNLIGRENKRNFIVGRGSFSGMHRFAALWTGDNSSEWKFLQINIAQVLALGLSGLPVVGQDIGGFERETDWQRWVSPELLIRWTIAGAFLPWFRNHYIRKGQKDFQEPFQYEEWFKERNLPLPNPPLYRMVVPICRHYIELRYRLMQLFYDAMFENMLNGMPICRAMFINDPQDKSLYNDKLIFIDTQFFVRHDLLVAPILEPETDPPAKRGKRDIYLPSGSNWYCFMDNQFPLSPYVLGGTTIRDYQAYLDASPDHIGFVLPIYIRAGAIIPTLELEQYVGERNAQGLPNPITLNIYPGERGEYTMYLDDGVSRSSAPKDIPQYQKDDQANSEYRVTHITHQFTGVKTREIKVERVFDNYKPRLEEYFFIDLLHDPSEPRGTSGPLSKVKLNGVDLGLVSNRDGLNASAVNAWYYDGNINISWIKVFDNNSLISMTVEYV